MRQIERDLDLEEARIRLGEPGEGVGGQQRGGPGDTLPRLLLKRPGLLRW